MAQSGKSANKKQGTEVSCLIGLPVGSGYAAIMLGAGKKKAIFAKIVSLFLNILNFGFNFIIKQVLFIIIFRCEKAKTSRHCFNHDSPA